MLIYNNETKYLVNDLGRTSAVVQTDSKGDEIREMYSYLDRVPAYPTEIIKTNKGIDAILSSESVSHNNPISKIVLNASLNNAQKNIMQGGNMGIKFNFNSKR